jgi:hypothetical protein
MAFLIAGSEERTCAVGLAALVTLANQERKAYGSLASNTAIDRRRSVNDQLILDREPFGRSVDDAIEEQELPVDVADTVHCSYVSISLFLTSVE